LKFKIIESKKTAKLKYGNKLTDEEFNNLINNDPSKTFKFSEFLCKVYIDNNIIVDKNDLIKWEEGLNRNKIRLDINNLSYEEFKEYLNNFESKDEEKSNIEKESNVIYEDDRFKIFKPLTHRGSVSCGVSKWCTAFKSDKHWNQYKQYSVDVYYIYDNLKNEKFAIGVYPDDMSQTMISNREFSEYRIELAKSPEGYPNPEGGEPLRIYNDDITFDDFILGDNVVETYDEDNIMMSSVKFINSLPIKNKLLSLIGV